MKTNLSIFCLLLLLLSTGCNSLIPSTGATATPPPPPTETVAASTPTPQATLEPTQTPLPSATPYTPFQAVTVADYVNVRSNPGLLFTVNLNVPKNTSFTVMGKSPGEDWIYISTTSNANGWIYRKLLKADQNLLLAPVVQPEHVRVITGKVLDQNQTPVSGITFSIQQGNIHNDVLSNSEGRFYVFLPENTSGEWQVVYNGIDCTSNLMDDKCNCKAETCGAANPPSLQIQVPNDNILEFVWKNNKP